MKIKQLQMKKPMHCAKCKGYLPKTSFQVRLFAGESEKATSTWHINCLQNELLDLTNHLQEINTIEIEAKIHDKEQQEPSLTNPLIL